LFSTWTLKWSNAQRLNTTIILLNHVPNYFVGYYSFHQFLKVKDNVVYYSRNVASLCIIEDKEWWKLMIIITIIIYTIINLPLYFQLLEPRGINKTLKINALLFNPLPKIKKKMVSRIQMYV